MPDYEPNKSRKARAKVTAKAEAEANRFASVKETGGG